MAEAGIDPKLTQAGWLLSEVQSPKAYGLTFWPWSSALCPYTRMMLV